MAGLLALGVVLGAAAAWWRLRSAAPAGETAVERGIPGEGERVVAEVLNPTSVVGLARTATRVLRDRGIDVVYFGSDTGSAPESTQVLVRRGPSEAGDRVARALGLGVVRLVPDAGRLVDVSVRLGRDFARQAPARLGNP